MNAQKEETIEQQIGKLLGLAVKVGASDVHLRANQPPMLRVSGELKPLNSPPFDLSTMRVIADRMTPSAIREKTGDQFQADFSAEWPGTARFRVHRFQVRGEPALVLRIIPLEVPDFAALRLPPAIKRVCAKDRGLVLVTGATGMGKSTSIAALLNHIAGHNRKHILTVEDPIEFVISPGTSIVSQRDVGHDVADFSTGIWAALREDPDIIFIGEIRDVETVRVALQAAETGHLIISAIHTVDATATIEHLIHMYPPDQQASARLRLAEVLEAVISQRLLPMKGHNRRVLTCEVLLRSPGIQEWIRKPDKSRPLVDRIAHSAPDGMQTFDQDLKRLYEAGVIEMEVARAAASSPSDFARNLRVI